VESTKDRIVNASADLFRRQGYTGTGLKQIVAAADAPFGSLYHFFPGGKEQLGEEVIRRSGAFYLLLEDAIFEPAPDLVTATREFFAGAAETLRNTDYTDACPIATVALEVASTSEPLRQATADVFESWVAAIARHAREEGISPKKSRELAVSVLALLEGAFILARAGRSTEPLEIAGATAVAAVKSALATRSSPGRRTRKKIAA
jgi:AcrR family transcriptional regulator